MRRSSARFRMTACLGAGLLAGAVTGLVDGARAAILTGGDLRATVLALLLAAAGGGGGQGVVDGLWRGHRGSRLGAVRGDPGSAESLPGRRGHGAGDGWGR